jgi:hypothetical protein
LKATAELCARLAERRSTATGSLDTERLNVFQEACKQNTVEGWVEATIRAAALDEVVCTIFTLDLGTYRFSLNDSGNWTSSKHFPRCDERLDITLETKDGFVRKYTETRRRASKEPSCQSTPATSTMTFSIEPRPIPITCKEIIFGF